MRVELPGMSRVARVLVAGDWDADGVVSAALLVYTQERLGKYPLPSVSVVDKKPVDPDRIKFLVSELSGPYDLAVFLDLPYADFVGNTLKILKSHFGVKKIMYVDHHLSTLHHREELEKVADVILVDHRIPTVGLLSRELSSAGIQLHARLSSFAKVVEYMDAGRRVPGELMRLFELTKTFSKALTVVRSPELWSKIVDWLADPTPLPMPLDEGILSRVMEAVKKKDEEVKEAATMLAMEALKVGDIRLIDARKKWKGRGATALASKLSSVLKAPVALLVDTNKNHSLLVIKAPGGRAYRIAKHLVGEGIGQDIAGHPNLAIVRVEKGISKEVLIQALYQASFYAR